MEKYLEMMEQAAELYDEANAIENAAAEYFIENELWSPMEELKEYLDKEDFTPPFTIFYTEPESEDPEQILSDYIYGDIVEIDENGYLYYSDYSDGIIEWDKTDFCYYRKFLGDYTRICILGFRKER
jgi:hypothetical protein